MPTEHYYGVLSEQFGGALITDLLRQEAMLPVGFVDQLLEYRAYAHAHAMNRADPKGFEASPMRQLAMEIEASFAEEALRGNG